LQRIELVAGGHPIPNEAGLTASRRILQLVSQGRPDDLFIGLISGGSSALMSCPVPGISLEDEAAATEELLKSGARILEINALRRHISRTNGGRLAQKMARPGDAVHVERAEEGFYLTDRTGDRTHGLSCPEPCCCTALGEIVEALAAEMKKQGLDGKVTLKKTGCHGSANEVPW
jgi:glycerate-2-kinase